MYVEIRILEWREGPCGDEHGPFTELMVVKNPLLAGRMVVLSSSLSRDDRIDIGVGYPPESLIVEALPTGVPWVLDDVPLGTRVAARGNSRGIKVALASGPDADAAPASLLDLFPREDGYFVPTTA